MQFEPRQFSGEQPLPPPLGGESSGSLSVDTMGDSSSTTDPTGAPTQNPTVPSATLSPNPSSSGSSSGPNAGAIAGGVIAGVVLVALIVVAFLFIRRRKRRMAPSTQFLARNPNWRSETPTSTAEHTGDEQPPPFTQGSFAYALLPEKRRSQPV
ncbi:hypothetical protein AAF712_002478 [Marasmius tenuissimus]|uniref:Uncharacterized protein n=1 Tax=Marasmius tenuissimus TaxID=585030 RepID=A0ABR3A9K0_9AGAR|nr:hypothetical protein PM082_020629 [Marasmius tenuissimus]